MKCFKCPKCNKVSSAEKWNETTRKFLEDDDIGLIEEEIESCNYKCPECKDYITGLDFDIHLDFTFTKI